MRYENREIPEGINVSRIHPLKDFAWMLAGVAIICLCLVGTAHLLAGWLVPHVPFELESRLLGSVDIEWLSQSEADEHTREKTIYLQDLADRMTERVPLPEGMLLSIHYSPSKQINAFATLGGHIVINQGLFDAVKTENGLAMVLAHEIGHMVNRDPLVATGRATVTLAALALLTGFSETRVADNLFTLRRFATQGEPAPAKPPCYQNS